jgi:2-dehydro-3-deoxyphosphooctonate aldolase (KDO 8-P synthase)
MKLFDRDVGNDQPLFLIAGPCVLEPGSITLDTAAKLAEITSELGMLFIFKASFDKANRSSAGSYRGPGMHEGLRVLEQIKSQLRVPILTDVHEQTPIDEVAAVVDVLQTPAFLARQTDFIQRVARAGKPINLKKGQFLAPGDMKQVVDKCRQAGNDQLLVCERGVSFGYNNLVADMRSLADMRETGCPVVFDATHAVQHPGGHGSRSGGERHMVPVLARAAVAAGIAGLFMETHPHPEQALSDADTQWPLPQMANLLRTLVAIDETVKSHPYAESQLLP